MTSMKEVTRILPSTDSVTSETEFLLDNGFDLTKEIKRKVKHLYWYMPPIVTYRQETGD